MSVSLSLPLSVDTYMHIYIYMFVHMCLCVFVLDLGPNIPSSSDVGRSDREAPDRVQLSWLLLRASGGRSGRSISS